MTNERHKVYKEGPRLLRLHDHIKRFVSKIDILVIEALDLSTIDHVENDCCRSTIGEVRPAMPKIQSRLTHRRVDGTLKLSVSMRFKKARTSRVWISW